MYVVEKSLCVDDGVAGNGDRPVRSEKALILPDLRSQSELDIAVPRPKIFAIFRCVPLQRLWLVEKLFSGADHAVASA